MIATGVLPKIWTSDCWGNPQRLQRLDFQRSVEGSELLERARLYERGHLWPEEWLPDYLFINLRGDRLSKSAQLFMIRGGFLAVSMRPAELLEQFELGQTWLHRVELRNYDEVTPMGKTFCFLNIAEHKDCLVPELSSDKVKASGKGDYYYTSAGGVDGIAVRDTAAAGVDLWMDPNLRNTPFFSDRLARAIKAGKFGRTGLTECKVVSTH